MRLDLTEALESVFRQSAASLYVGRTPEEKAAQAALRDAYLRSAEQMRKQAMQLRFEAELSDQQRRYL